MPTMFVVAAAVVLVCVIAFFVFKKRDGKSAEAQEEALVPEPVLESVVDKDEPVVADGFVRVDDVHMDLSFDTRDDVLAYLSNEAVKSGVATDAEALKAAFLERESEGSTGMMDGFAIPHAKCDAVNEAAVIVIKDDSGIAEWDTMDDEPVKVAIALLIPAHQKSPDNLKLLSKVAESLMDKEFRATVKSADSAATIASAINAHLA